MKILKWVAIMLPIIILCFFGVVAVGFFFFAPKGSDINPDTFGTLVGGIAGFFGLFVGLITSIISLAVFGFAGYMIYKMMIKPHFDYKRIAETGIKAKAKVLMLAETGTLINHRPVVNIQLQVMPPNSAPYVAITQRTISMLEVTRFQPNNIVDVIIDSQDSSKVVISNLQTV